MTTDAVGGVWIFATTLSAALAKQGYQVTLATLGPPPRCDQLDANSLSDGVAIEITDFPLEWMDPSGADANRARDGLAALARRIQPDLVHLNSYREATADWGAPVIVTAHSCVRSWWNACHGGEPQEPQWQIYIGTVAAGLAAADLWVAPSAAFRDLVELLYAPPSRGHVIHNGIGSITPGESKEEFILAAGRLWDEGKNIAALAEIASKLPWPVWIAGSAKTDINAVELGAGIQMLGELSRAELLAWMQRAPILVAPARYEPFGLAVLEAAASGCALVLSDIPTFRELWAGAALFVDPHDPNAIRAALDLLCRDAGLRQKLQGAAARQAGRYSLEPMTTSYRSLYDTMIAGRVPSFAPLELQRAEAHA